jgi:hypothetical protein
MISYQPCPKIPPIGFFQPISADPKDMMTDVEFLLGMLKKLNETIKQVNSNAEWISNYTGRVEEIEAEITALRTEMNEFESEVNANIDSRFTQIVADLNAAIATTLQQANAYTDVRAALLQQMIEDVVAGQIQVYDPTTGILSPLQTVIDNLYGSSRSDALTATEYDALLLTATGYDNYELTAKDYDQNAKSLLV